MSFGGQAIVFDEVIFCITHKVASVSIQYALALWKGFDPFDGPNKFQYVPVEDIVTYTQPKIAVVRDPWSRLLSCYRQKIEGKDQSGFIDWGMYGNMPFSEFVDCIKNTWGNFNTHWAPCHLWADLATVVVRFENLSAEWDELPYDLPKLPHHFSTGSSGLIEQYYDHSLKEKVRQLYKQDVDNWYGDWHNE